MHIQLTFYNSQDGNLKERVESMLQKGIPQAVVDIYYTSTMVNGEVIISQNPSSSFEQNEYNYMKTNAFTYVNDALAEYRANH